MLPLRFHPGGILSSKRTHGEGPPSAPGLLSPLLSARGESCTAPCATVGAS